jgi:membrane-associated phospholipid phosphatase
MHNKIVLVLFFSTLFSRLAFCQQVHLQPENGYLKSYLTDTRDLVVQPVHWKATEWLVVGGAAVTFTAIYANDLKIQEFWQQNQSDQADFISKYVAEPFGSGLYTLPALGILYGSGWVFDNEKSRHVALLGAKAWVLTGAATVVLKQLAHRQRPNEGEHPDPYFWKGPYAFTSSMTSFPSGHTSTAFAVAAVIAGSYPEKWWLGALSYSAATLVGASRMYDNKHWGSDVFVGALLGWWVGHSLVKSHSAFEWGANVGSNHATAQFVYRF